MCRRLPVWMEKNYIQSTVWVVCYPFHSILRRGLYSCSGPQGESPVSHYWVIPGVVSRWFSQGDLFHSLNTLCRRGAGRAAGGVRSRELLDELGSYTGPCDWAARERLALYLLCEVCRRETLAEVLQDGGRSSPVHNQTPGGPPHRYNRSQSSPERLQGSGKSLFNAVE